MSVSASYELPVWFNMLLPIPFCLFVWVMRTSNKQIILFSFSASAFSWLLIISYMFGSVSRGPVDSLVGDSCLRAEQNPSLSLIPLGSFKKNGVLSQVPLEFQFDFPNQEQYILSSLSIPPIRRQALTWDSAKFSCKYSAYSVWGIGRGCGCVLLTWLFHCHKTPTPVGNRKPAGLCFSGVCTLSFLIRHHDGGKSKRSTHAMRRDKKLFFTRERLLGCQDAKTSFTSQRSPALLFTSPGTSPVL